MQFPKFNKPETLTESKRTNPSLQQAIADIQNNCSSFVQHISGFLQQQRQQRLNFGLFNPNPSALKSHIEFALGNLGNQAKQALQNGISGVRSSSSSQRNQVWARVSVKNDAPGEPVHRLELAMSTADIEERLAGVPVYALSNAAEEFVLVSGTNTGKSLGLFCFRKEDAEALLEQMRSMEPGMRRGSKVVTVPLNKVFQLKLSGVSFRFIPDASQIKNAVKERKKAGVSDEGFPGVPVFQSRSLILRSQHKRYRPVFFRKEDLENSLLRASNQQKLLNPALRQGEIQVEVLEDIIKAMKDGPFSKWDDVVFIPPGFDVSTDIPQQERATATG